MKILAVSGSLRHDSWNTKLLRAAEELVPAASELELYDALKEIPPYDEDDDHDEDDDRESGPAAVARFRAAIAGADAVLFASPEYNSSVPRAAEERTGLGVAAARDERAPQQAGRRGRREHRRLRRRLVAG